MGDQDVFPILCPGSLLPYDEIKNPNGIKYTDHHITIPKDPDVLIFCDKFYSALNPPFGDENYLNFSLEERCGDPTCEDKCCTGHKRRKLNET